MPNFTPGTYPAFMSDYLRLVDAETIGEAINKYSGSIQNFFENIPSEKTGYRYAADKWNIREVLQHLIDAERIFTYRALSIARHDKTPLPGFDEKNYAAFSDANLRSWENLLEEFFAVRKSTDFLLQSFTSDQLKQSGITNNEPNTTEAISFVVFGHILHHKRILKERYL